MDQIGTGEGFHRLMGMGYDFADSEDVAKGIRGLNSAAH